MTSRKILFQYSTYKVKFIGLAIVLIYLVGLMLDTLNIIKIPFFQDEASKAFLAFGLFTIATSKEKNETNKILKIRNTSLKIFFTFFNILIMGLAFKFHHISLFTILTSVSSLYLIIYYIGLWFIPTFYEKNIS